MARFTQNVSNGAGGNANTGDITFDGVKIIGAGTASGDGENRGTMQLVPDASLIEQQYHEDQYLIIDPTTPNHIHIRPGGTQDASTADLILGGEKTQVLISDTGDYVDIKTTSSEDFAQTWRFNSDGLLTGPAMGSVGVSGLYNNPGYDLYIGSADGVVLTGNDGEFLHDSNTPGNQIATLNDVAKTTGSWTVATGTATYNFTLPSDGTYSMWVKGNIANGIIVWNATVTVTNNNVPAIGSQYAWNYTSGGSPILITAIPNQIRGVAGTINTDATYSGNSSNRFDFTIANTSGESQTVYYGYTKI
jgi:hypothetical protein